MAAPKGNKYWKLRFQSLGESEFSLCDYTTYPANDDTVYDKYDPALLDILKNGVILMGTRRRDSYDKSEGIKERVESITGGRITSDPNKKTSGNYLTVGDQRIKIILTRDGFIVDKKPLLEKWRIMEYLSQYFPSMTFVGENYFLQVIC